MDVLHSACTQNRIHRRFLLYNFASFSFNSIILTDSSRKIYPFSKKICINFVFIRHNQRWNRCVFTICHANIQKLLILSLIRLPKNCKWAEGCHGLQQWEEAALPAPPWADSPRSIHPRERLSCTSFHRWIPVACLNSVPLFLERKMRLVNEKYHSSSESVWTFYRPVL